MYKYLVEPLIPILLCEHLEVELLGHMVNLFLSVREATAVSPPWSHRVTVSPAVHGGPVLHIPADSDYPLFLDSSRPSGCEVVSLCGFNLTHGAEYLLTCRWPFVCLLWGDLCSSPLPILHWAACLFLVELRRFFL